MKAYLLAAVILSLVSRALALDGQVQIHDPSTLVLCDGKYYTYGTGGTALNGGSMKLRQGPVTREVKLRQGETHRWNGQ